MIYQTKHVSEQKPLRRGGSDSLLDNFLNYSIVVFAVYSSAFLFLENKKNLKTENDFLFSVFFAGGGDVRMDTSQQAQVNLLLSISFHFKFNSHS